MDLPEGLTHGEDDQLWIGWAWFELHAKQRLEMLRFFVTIYGAIAAAAAGFLQTPYVFVSSCLSIIAMLLTLVFWQLDRRSTQLVEIGERVLSHRWIELRFARDFDPVAQAQVRRDEGVRYKHAFLVLFIGSALLAFGLFVMSIYMIDFPSTAAVTKKA
jgi:hypothetical protein